ncbi:O-antigen ligase family protein [Novosphingobium guangzhouense]|uniref:O-antigen ligase-related domain-containing protein n=1 Tax=Novosphingobium guangzhouense TaxID=1850347 RepID=A0A2K2FZ54_9SPHN|nr:O-antigen ligase family protein [Novosphingobium guangzhouense]PNU04069.1 hypothetical protein A8V01_05555 [Novosphingobium guangzhouense]
MLVGILLGGGGVNAAFSNLVVQLAAILCIALNGRVFGGFAREAPRYLVALLALTLLLPLLQMLSLPPAIWRALPGRDLISESLSLIGKPDAWFPMTVDLRRTAIAFAAMLPPLLIIVMGYRLSHRERQLLLGAIALAGVFCVLLGLPQLASNNHLFVFYAETYGLHNLHGLFANRNTTALFLDIALVALVFAVPAGRMKAGAMLAIAICGLLLVVGIVLTGSRSGIGIALVPVVCALARIYIAYRGLIRRKHVVMTVLAGVVALVGAASVVSQSGRLQRSFDRFESLEDARPAIWSDTRNVIDRYWPVGSGIGTFDEVFQVDESLETLSFGRARRAHNDLLEISVESGIFGLLLLVGWLVLVVWETVRSWHAREGTSVAPIVVFAMLLMQSTVDYPLRNQAMLCVASAMLAMMLSRSRSVHRRDSNETE